MTKSHDSKPCCVHLIFVIASSTRGRLRATRVRIGIAGLDCLPHPPGLCFSRWHFPTAMQRSHWATQELSSFPGRELVPHLALPTPGVVPDVDTTELVPDIIVPWHRLILLVIFSFVYIFLYCFNYTLSNSRPSIGVLRSCISIQGLIPSPNSARASCPPTVPVSLNHT